MRYAVWDLSKKAKYFENGKTNTKLSNVRHEADAIPAKIPLTPCICRLIKTIMETKFEREQDQEFNEYCFCKKTSRILH